METINITNPQTLSYLKWCDNNMKNFSQVAIAPSVLVTQATASMAKGVEEDLKVEDPEEAKAKELIDKYSFDTVIVNQ